ncbi:AraC family transcriptional regulator [Polyangium aurulentum]|uniref:AraC family transcriptional regulator n=1 Tax=Polyangium aurulentum TaxID=2567896 RepID=UPI00146C15E0|nr:AraC family transcriptional regulator [Polyangium aurulentum]UQA60925.1 AraC family transcriptional regulator [Polyangium aurulentum]
MQRALKVVPRMPVAHVPRSADGHLAALVVERAKADGSSESPFPGLRYHRLSSRCTYTNVRYFAPTLTVVMQGAKRANVGGREVRYDPSHYVVVVGEVSCDGTISDASRERPYLAVCLELPPDLITKIVLTLADSHDEPSGDPAAAFVSNLDDPIRDGLIRLIKAVDDPLDRRVLAPLVVEELVFRLLRSDAAAVMRGAVAGRSQDAVNVQKAMRFMREHAARALSVEDLAKHVGMSPSHFAHRFRAIAWVSPMQYLKQVRLQRGRELLLGDGMRVSDAARTVGYESPSHFSRDFKRCYGSTPAAYLRRFRA